ncbi:UdgX family uracil-DNA binding protein [Ancylobacter sp. Lp-2]|uniref:UdgX family uracil-DNA binding protein n=1 Tax=Ancylobacter sp. Lp-2 TaxID=2881339 RepID=UPI001E309207|nr:UdgX family uracil-DNA binding protein [Ancylobacter sp. Lp-2]MCB4768826.1 UdgX family uracil-DNA binding protein [Ancylobacter sp. Lp-2]
MVVKEFTSLAALNDALQAALTPGPGIGRVVVGEGAVPSPIALVGEQPGDEEDRQGRPFVGPAGRVLDRALADAGIERRLAYVTNAVKRFNFVERGKRRLHRKPNASEVTQERWWLERELAFVQPEVVVALGATAGLALAGRRVTVTRERGPLTFGRRRGVLTVHPSYLLRMPDEAGRKEAYDAFVADLVCAREMAQQAGRTAVR